MPSFSHRRSVSLAAIRRSLPSLADPRRRSPLADRSSLTHCRRSLVATPLLSAHRRSLLSPLCSPLSPISSLLVILSSPLTVLSSPLAALSSPLASSGCAASSAGRKITFHVTGVIHKGTIADLSPQDSTLLSNIIEVGRLPSFKREDDEIQYAFYILTHHGLHYECSSNSKIQDVVMLLKCLNCSYLTLELMVRVAGDPFQKRRAFSAAARAAASAGSTISALTSKEATSLKKNELIIKLHSLLGNKWSLIAGRLPGRTDNEIKNYWNTHIRRKLLSRGIDPATHRPLNDSSASHHHHNNNNQEQQQQQHQQQQQQPSSLVAATITTISFASSISASASAVKQEQDTTTTTITIATTTSATCNANMFGIMEKKKNNNKDYSKGSSMERCPDLNLELTISLPRHVDKPDHQKFSGVERALCFVCSLGLQNNKDCRCGFATNANANGGSNSNSNTTTTANTTTGAGYDFLGLKPGSVWDYRSLEMK